MNLFKVAVLLDAAGDKAAEWLFGVAYLIRKS